MKKLVKNILLKLGYKITKAGMQRGFNSSYLARICSPNTVIDIGVGYGTTPLYEAYPEAKFILIEPLRDYQGAIDAIRKKYDCLVYYKALSNAEGVRHINVDPGDLTKSSLQDRTLLTKSDNPLRKQRVEVTTLDLITRENQDFKAPILIKIDTEGHELEVLQGARELLKITDTVIAEVSIARRFENSYSFEDIIRYMKENGFYVYDFLTITYSHKELRPRYADIVFKKNTDKP